MRRRRGRRYARRSQFDLVAGPAHESNEHYDRDQGPVLDEANMPAAALRMKAAADVCISSDIADLPDDINAREGCEG